MATDGEIVMRLFSAIKDAVGKDEEGIQKERQSVLFEMGSGGEAVEAAKRVREALECFGVTWKRYHAGARWETTIPLENSELPLNLTAMSLSKRYYLVVGFSENRLNAKSILRSIRSKKFVNYFKERRPFVLKKEGKWAAETRQYYLNKMNERFEMLYPGETLVFFETEEGIFVEYGKKE